MRILAVDDDPVFLGLLEKYLREIGYQETVFCDSGPEAFRLLRSDARGFDCLLFDIQMPEMDGIELCKCIRAMPDYARTPVLMLTAMAETQYIDAAFLAGASDYITKPLKRAELTARLSLASALNRERMRLSANAGGVAVGYAHAGFRFSDPVMLHDVHGVLELMALKNYALTLGNLRMQNWKSVGFATLGASEFFAACGPEQYLELMKDVGSVLFDTLKHGQLMMAHAGSGCFVSLISRHSACEPAELEAQANAYLQPFHEHYREVSSLPITIAAGTAQRNGLLSLKPADDPINRAIVSAQERASNLNANPAY